MNREAVLTTGRQLGIEYPGGYVKWYEVTDFAADEIRTGVERAAAQVQRDRHNARYNYADEPPLRFLVRDLVVEYGPAREIREEETFEEEPRA